MKMVTVISALVFGSVLAQSEIDENYRCTDLIHACLYEYEETGERVAEFQVGRYSPDTKCEEMKLWFLIRENNQWPEPHFWLGDDPDLELEETETLCRWSINPEIYEPIGDLDYVGFQLNQGTKRSWVIGRADLTIVNVPAPYVPKSHRELEDEPEVKPYNPCVSGFQPGTSYTGQCHSGNWQYFQYDATPGNHPKERYLLRESIFVCGHNGSTNNAPGEPTNGWYCTGNANHEWVWVRVR